MDFYKNLDEKQRNLFWIAVLLLTGLLSMTLFAKAATSPAFTQACIAYLDSKKKTVLELTAAATASSAAITMIPGDIGTPIADKLADISTYTMIVLCAVFLEKYLVTITGHVVFRFLIPFACLMTIGSLIRPRFVNWRRTALRVCLFSVILYFVIPASVGISKTIENTYDNSIQETIDSAKESAEEIQDNAETQTIWDRFISTIEGGVNTVTSRFEGILNNFIEAVAVLIVTACVIPVLVLVVMFWIVKMLFGIDSRFAIPRLPRTGTNI